MSYMKFLLSEINDSVMCEDVYDELNAFLTSSLLDAFLGREEELEELICKWIEQLEELIKNKKKAKEVLTPV